MSRHNGRNWALVLTLLSFAHLRGQDLSDLTTPTPLPPGSTLVIGFLGGYERWDDEHRSVRRLVLRLRQQPGVCAESVSNHRRQVALQFIERALDRNRNGRLDPEERAGARLILLGQSWGGAAAIATARDLERLGIPVLLTVQVDSVGLHDRVIPPNVRAAVNFYQHDPFTFQGAQDIRAADRSRTAILGNFRRWYPPGSVDESNASWPRRTFGGSHARMELDPEVWSQVNHFISDAIMGRTP
jgi:pimeloyl-ACP methyl ester carboxylesterase